MRRQFSDGTDTAFMEMRQFSPNGALQFIVYSDTMETRSRRFRYQVMPDTEERENPNAFRISLNDGGTGMMFNGSLSTAAMAEAASDGDIEITDEQRRQREAEVTGIHFSNSFEHPLVLETGSMADPMGAMRGCMDNLLTFWGIDVDAHQSLTREVQPLRMRQWVHRFVREYPSGALREGEQASLNLRLIINTEGEVEECHVQSAVGLEVFHDTACDGLRRHARFEPALDAAGNAIRSYWTTSVLYQIG
ncbi:energy transducer TonB [Aurantiacibacter sediminis]|nr:energy transducer TonB [Aurantiacibacter sediminis]